VLRGRATGPATRKGASQWPSRLTRNSPERGSSHWCSAGHPAGGPRCCQPSQAVSSASRKPAKRTGSRPRNWQSGCDYHLQNCASVGAAWTRQRREKAPPEQGRVDSSPMKGARTSAQWHPTQRPLRPARRRGKRKSRTNSRQKGAGRGSPQEIAVEREMTISALISQTDADRQPLKSQPFFNQVGSCWRRALESRIRAFAPAPRSSGPQQPGLFSSGLGANDRRK
jgi:hypothetical protein